MIRICNISFFRFCWKNGKLDWPKCARTLDKGYFDRIYGTHKLFDRAESLRRREKQNQASLVYYSTISSPLIKRESKLCYFPKICSNTNSSETWHSQDLTRTKVPL